MINLVQFCGYFLQFNEKLAGIRETIGVLSKALLEIEKIIYPTNNCNWFLYHLIGYQNLPSFAIFSFEALFPYQHSSFYIIFKLNMFPWTHQWSIVEKRSGKMSGTYSRVWINKLCCEYQSNCFCQVPSSPFLKMS